MGLLSKAAAVLNSAVSNPGEASDGAAGIWAHIDHFQKSNPSFHCIVLQTPPENGARNIIRTAAIMTAHCGSACLLPDGNCLVLVSGGLDGKLIAHRLSKSMKIKTLSLFSAESSVRGAFEALRTHL
ncbi:MAG: hypothetical protein LBD47_10190 [Treponema sp.]|jgi:hypothetical protein|nr:hypothetical protein [Treponema sp.]